MVEQPAAEIRDPVHGYVKITEVEREVIDSPFVQRLRRIHQLAGAYLVYPGAVHTRFEHVLGAMHLAGLVGERLAEASELSADSIQLLRLAALLHDVGHGPFSHMYEEVLAERSEISHEDITQRIITETNVRDILESQGYSARRVSALSVGKQRNAESFMNEIIAGGISVDMMDYLLRDSHFTGVEYGKVDVQRIVNSLHAADGHLALDQAALHTFESLLLARYEMFRSVYFHRTVRAAELMVIHAMSIADEVLGLTDLENLDFYLELTDELVIQRLISLRQTSKRLRRARSLAVDFRNRRLVKCAYERLFQRKDETMGRLFADPATRREATASLARFAHVDEEEIFLDVPTTPSVPYTPSKEVLTNVRLMQNTRRRGVWEVPIKDLPLVGSIAGFMDVVRVYAPQQMRSPIERAAAREFGESIPAGSPPI